MIACNIVIGSISLPTPMTWMRRIIPTYIAQPDTFQFPQRSGPESHLYGKAQHWIVLFILILDAPATNAFLITTLKACRIIISIPAPCTGYDLGRRFWKITYRPFQFPHPREGCDGLYCIWCNDEDKFQFPHPWMRPERLAENP